MNYLRVKLSRLALSLGLLSLLGSCGGKQLAGEQVSFRVAAAGPLVESMTAGQPLSFTNARNYGVVLEQAQLHIGALYLNESRPTAEGQGTGCFLPGIYVGEVRNGLDVDLLNPQKQFFRESGNGLALTAAVGEVWLTGGPIEQVDDPTVIFQAKGTATKGGQDYPFVVEFTIGRNRYRPSSDPAYPGAFLICKERIVSPILVKSLTLQQGGTLLLRIDPRGIFANVDFAKLKPDPDNPLRYRFRDTVDSTATTADLALFAGLKASFGVYEFSWLAN